MLPQIGSIKLDELTHFSPCIRLLVSQWWCMYQWDALSSIAYLGLASSHQWLWILASDQKKRFRNGELHGCASRQPSLGAVSQIPHRHFESWYRPWYNLHSVLWALFHILIYVRPGAKALWRRVPGEVSTLVIWCYCVNTMKCTHVA